MALVRWDPFAELSSLHDQLNNVFSDTFSSQRNLLAAPVTDVYMENDNKQLVVEAHLPNFKEDEVSVNINEGALEIKAEHHEKDEEKKKRHYMVRESSSSFYRRIALPKQADEEKIAADFDKGVLKVIVPFKELPQPKKIAIEAKSKK